MITSAVPLWLDLLCVGFGSFQGALFAIFYKRFDLVGVIALAFLSGLGGGVLRDLLLGVGRPVGMQNNYLLTAILGALLAAIIGRWFARLRNTVIFLDSVAMSLFAIAGTYKALIYNTSVLVAVLLGVVTAVGGGVLRDVVSRITPQIFTGGPLYATATAIGAALFAFLYSTSINLNISVAITAIVIVTIHMTSVRFRIHLKPVSSEALPSDFE